VNAGRIYVTVFAVAVPLQFLWEMAQAPLYGSMGTAWQATWRCFLASLGDGIITLIVAAGGFAAFRSSSWFVDRRPARYVFAGAVGLMIAIAVEWWGLTTGQWAYSEAMPTVPATNLGLVPLGQMALLVPVTLRIAAAPLRRR
jgi:hypothetical protein